jgi:flagellar biosynthetic protein FliR
MLSIETIYTQINHIIWPTIRVLALFTSAPIFSEKSINKKTKIALAMCISWLISQNLPESRIAIFSLAGIGLAFQQIFFGVMMGLTVQLLFVAVRSAGEIMGMQMGLSFAMFFDPNGGQNTPVISRILNLLVTLLFLTFDGHLWMISVLHESFVVLPVSVEQLNTQGAYYLAVQATFIFRCGLMLGLPVIALLLTINLTLGLLNRLTPQLSIFVVGFPLTLTVGMMALLLKIYSLPPFFSNLMNEVFYHLSKILILSG